MAASSTKWIGAVLSGLRGALGTGEHPAGSNSNFIVDWYNKYVARIGNGSWCEMTNTWAMWAHGAKKLKRGRAYCPWAAADGKNKVNGSSWHWGTKGMRAGDQVYYNWSRRKGSTDYCEHTGTVEKINGDGTFYVLEGNTSDHLLRRHRDGTYVVGYVRFDWGRLTGEPPAPKPVTPPKPGELKVDGVLGSKTVALWQHVMGTPVDGKISHPSALVKKVQSRLRDTVNHRLVIDGEGIAQDGRSYQTVRALQQYLKTPVDGRLSRPISNTVKALQRKLNTGKF